MEALNAKQLEAVQAIEGPLLVLAGAGSGKTRVITYRIAHLIEACGVRPEQILAVTFTNKAAGEMKSRVLAMLDPGLRTGSPLISTFHSMCVRILRRNIQKMNAAYTRDFTIYDTDDQLRVVRGIMKDLDIEDKSLTARQALSAISWEKNRGVSPAAYANREHVTDRTEKIARIFKLYEDRLRGSNALDFDDLLIKTVVLLRNVPDVRSYYHERFRHVMVDEFQDTNGIQYELTRLIAAGSTENVHGQEKRDALWRERSFCVVGDIDQSVYGFRGSDFNIILGFQHDFEGTKLIKLEQNYRSTQTILEAANGVIAKNQRRLPKNLYATPELGAGEKIGYYQSYDGDGEASFVAEKIQEHLARTHGTRCAVLYRTNAQSRLFEESLRRRNVAYNIVGGFSFYERAEVKDVIAYLKLAMNPNDDVAMARVINTPVRGIGKTTLEALARQQRDLGLSFWEALAAAVARRELQPRTLAALEAFRRVVISLGEMVAAGETPSEVIKAATMDTGYVRALQEEKSVEAEGRLLNIEELVSAAVEAEEKGESLRDFIDYAALVSDTDQYRADAQVTLLTMHSAKGLEFPVVFIVGLEEGLFPHSRAFESADDLEEERRLCYVGITRAQRHLYITHAMQRRTWGEELPAEPSRFLNEIPLELLEDMSRGPSWLGFALRPETLRNRQAAAALRGDAPAPVKKSSNYTGKTYNSVDGVREFFKQRAQTGGEGRAPSRRSGGSVGSGKRNETHGGAGSASDSELRVGSKVRHSKYGNGVVLRVEGAGEEAKLTVSFPGYGQKKFVAKFAALERV
ncbi:MAG: UvrD-helicase domain-containing protein [Acidobacteriota bacterium]